jgi:hypothetical protein
MSAAHGTVGILLQPDTQASRMVFMRTVQPDDAAVLCDFAVANAAFLRLAYGILLYFVNGV